MTTRTKLLLTFKLSFSVGLLYIVLSSIDLGEILSRLRAVDLPLFVLAYGLMIMVLGLSALRWQLFAPSLLPYTKALKYTWIGVFYSHILPGALSGDVAKGVSLALKDPDARVSALPMSILADKALGLIVLVLLFDVACVLLYLFDDQSFVVLSHIAFTLLVGSLGGLSLVGISARMLLRAKPKIQPGVSRAPAVWQRLLVTLYQVASYCTENPAIAWKAIWLSAGVHIVNILAFYVSLHALNIDADLFLAAIVYPILSVILMVPVSISGIGVREATLVTLFQLFGFGAVAAVATSWLNLIASMPNILIGGALQLKEIYRK